MHYQVPSKVNTKMSGIPLKLPCFIHSLQGDCVACVFWYSDSFLVTSLWCKWVTQLVPVSGMCQEWTLVPVITLDLIKEAAVLWVFQFLWPTSSSVTLRSWILFTVTELRSESLPSGASHRRTTLAETKTGTEPDEKCVSCVKCSGLIWQRRNRTPHEKMGKLETMR